MDNKINLKMKTMFLLKVMFGILFLALASSPILAGVSSSYWKENPLMMYPGETKQVELILQNMIGEKEIIYQAEIVKGIEIARLTDSIHDYLVPFGRDDIKVYLEISIPDSSYETNYEIKISFREIKQVSNGFVQLGAGIVTTIPVTIKETPSPEQVIEEPRTKTNMVLIALLIIILAFGIVLLKKKNNNE